MISGNFYEDFCGMRVKKISLTESQKIEHTYATMGILANAAGKAIPSLEDFKSLRTEFKFLCLLNHTSVSSLKLDLEAAKKEKAKSQNDSTVEKMKKDEYEEIDFDCSIDPECIPELEKELNFFENLETPLEGINNEKIVEVFKYAQVELETLGNFGDRVIEEA